MDAGLGNLYNIGSNYNINVNKKGDSSLEKEALKDDKKISNKESKNSENKANQKKLTQDEEQILSELQSIDSEVRAHELAHQSAGGGLAGAASFSYQEGPDGKMYAISGEVPISAPASSNPDETISNAQKIIAAATAPANPSSQDIAVASSARMMMIKAQQQKMQESQNPDKATKAYQDNTLQNQDNKEKEKNLDMSI